MPSILTPEQAFLHLHSLFSDHRKEYFGVLALNKRNILCGSQIIARGSHKHCVVQIRDIYRFAMEKKADAIIVGHNHPSGVLQPSRIDLRFTRRLTIASLILDVPLLDHLIIRTQPDAAFLSLTEHGHIKVFSRGASRKRSR